MSREWELAQWLHFTDGGKLCIFYGFISTLPEVMTDKRKMQPDLLLLTAGK